MRILISICLSLTLATVALAAGKEVSYQIGEQQFEGYFISPKDKAPLVLMIHDWDGLTDYEVKRAQMLVDLGYAVFVGDMFGKGIRPTEITEKKKLTGSLYKDRSRMRQLLQGMLSAAQSQGGDLSNAIIMGYCFGGTVVLELARSGENLKGFVTFHGGLNTPENQDYSQTKGKLLVLHGSADKAVSMEQFANLTVELEQQNIAHEMITYSGAPHAFSVFGSERYRAEADRKSWLRFTEYLQETLN
jgi:dienelactone hydrolase